MRVPQSLHTIGRVPLGSSVPTLRTDKVCPVYRRGGAAAGKALPLGRSSLTTSGCVHSGSRHSSPARDPRISSDGEAGEPPRMVAVKNEDMGDSSGTRTAGVAGPVGQQFQESVLGEWVTLGITAGHVVEHEQATGRCDVEACGQRHFVGAALLGHARGIVGARRCLARRWRSSAHATGCASGKNFSRSRGSSARSVHRMCTRPSSATNRSHGPIQPHVLSRLAISTQGSNLPVVMSSDQV